ncbi:hypothetical protein QYM36_006042 [Artemia franciscana]|uniref:type I protein arginine methyltransferase n=1 Tax=Artemia franciscana TaxID=6661 RepID=A0AA88IBP2_ARTSF|nr:hypothetical protein QYM36_006042 [Artemia franciscana]
MVHHLMLKDHPRTQAYKDAIMRNPSLFRNKIVMDVGSGTGILSLFCARAGAKKVYAVEASTKMAKLCQEIVKENGYEETIEVIQDQVENIQPHLKVDIIVSEWMGFYLLHESMLDSVIFARDNFLRQPEGILFPSHARIYAAPCSLSTLYKNDINFWDNVYGFSMNSVKNSMMLSKVSKPQILDVASDDILSEPVVIAEFDLAWMDPYDLQCFSSRKFISISKTGKHHGLCIWFDVDFRFDHYQNVTLSTSPMAPSTHWKQTVLVLPSPSDVEEGDILGWEMTFKQDDKNKRHYLITYGGLDPEIEDHPMPCCCQSVRCTLIAEMLKKEEEELGCEIFDV